MNSVAEFCLQNMEYCRPDESDEFFCLFAEGGIPCTGLERGVNFVCRAWVTVALT